MRTFVIPDSANFFDYLVTPSQMTGNSLQLLQSCYEAHKNVEVAKSDNSASPTCASKLANTNLSTCIEKRAH